MQVSYTTLDEGSNILISLILMQALKKVGDLTTQTIWIIRGIFALSLLVHGGLIFRIKKYMSEKNDQRKVKIPSSVDETEEEEISYFEYDTREYNKLVKGMIIQLIITIFIHYKWSIIQPLIIQTVAPIKSILLKPLFMVYLRGKEMLRPYESNLLMGKVDVEEEKVKKKKEE